MRSSKQTVVRATVTKQTVKGRISKLCTVEEQRVQGKYGGLGKRPWTAALQSAAYAENCAQDKDESRANTSELKTRTQAIGYCSTNHYRPVCASTLPGDSCIRPREPIPNNYGYMVVRQRLLLCFVPYSPLCPKINIRVVMLSMSIGVWAGNLYSIHQRMWMYPIRWTIYPNISHSTDKNKKALYYIQDSHRHATEFRLRNYHSLYTRLPG